jgi:hypothetical protein
MPARTLTMGFFGLVLAALPGACGGASPSAPAARPDPGGVPAPVQKAEVPSGFDGPFGERLLSRVPARVSLPGARGWHAHPSGSFTLLEHATTHSTLALRVVNAARLVRPEQCEADARLARPSLPASDGESIVERRTLAAPRGFDTRLVVGVEPRAGGTVRGFALAVGAATGRCYVACFETESVGPRAPDEVADRLAVVVSGVFETLRVPGAEERASPPIGVK